MTQRALTEFENVVRWNVIENCVTICAAAVTLVGLYTMGGGPLCLLGLLFFLNLNGPVKRKSVDDGEQPPADRLKKEG